MSYRIDPVEKVRKNKYLPPKSSGKPSFKQATGGFQEILNKLITKKTPSPNWKDKN